MEMQRVNLDMYMINKYTKWRDLVVNLNLPSHFGFLLYRLALNVRPLTYNQTVLRRHHSLVVFKKYLILIL